MVATILIAEDERDLNNLIRKHLEQEGHRVLQAFDGQSAVQMTAREQPNLIVLDWMLPRLDGLEVCKRLRRECVVPILMLTARAEEIDRVLGLEVGADDYMTKPFSLRELSARVHALLRRVEFDQTISSDLEEPPLLLVGSLQMDLAAHRVTVDGQPVVLAPKEFDLLELLAHHPGRAFAREYLLQKVWGYDANGSDRTVDTHILRLRKKLGPSGERIETVWGLGYRFAKE